MTESHEATIGLSIVCISAPPPSAHAQTPAEFFKGKQVSLYIGFSAGGTYDLYGRVVARHIGKHIPGNPTVVPKNMEGAGSIRLTNYMYTQAPKDGTALATMGRGGAFGPLFGMKGAQFDAERFLWLGSANDEVSLCAVLASSRRQELRRRAPEGIDHRRHRPRRREPDRAEAAQCRARLQVQGHRRLSRLERDDDLDRARRDAGTLRVLLGEHEERAPPVARREEDQHPGAALLPEASRAAARAARRRSRQDRGGEADDQPARGAAGDGPAVLHDRPTCRPTAPRRCARRSSTR